MGRKKHIMLPAKLDTDHRCMMRKFPAEHGEFSVKAVVDQHLAAMNGPYNSGGWIHPSSMGGCLRAVYYDRMDAPGLRYDHPDNRKLMEYATAIHERLQTWTLAEMGSEEFLCERRMRFPPFRISFRCDGVLLVKDWLLEIKTVSDSAFRTLHSPRAKDLLQAHVYMYCLDIPRILFYYVNRNDGRDQEFKEYFDPGVWDKVCQVVVSIEEHVKKKTRPPRIKSTFTCDRCTYCKHCHEDKE